MNSIRRRIGPIFGLVCLAALGGCASQSREPGRAAAAPPSAETAPMSAEQRSREGSAYSSQPASDAADESGNSYTATPPQHEAAARDTEGAAASPIHSQPKVTPSTTTEHPRQAPAAASKAKREEAVAAPKSRAAQAEPSFAEPPELQAALEQFESQWEQLSTSRACDDACRALESMRRSAERICDIVVAADPRERCRSARARLEQASRDLVARCADCR